MLNAIMDTRERLPGGEHMSALARWLASQRAMPVSLAEATAWQLIEEAKEGGLELQGPNAPLIVQPRFSLWLVGQLGGRPLMHVFASEGAASAKAQELGAEMRLSVLVIDRGGDIVNRFDPPSHTAVAAMIRANPQLAPSATTPASAPPPAPSLVQAEPLNAEPLNAEPLKAEPAAHPWSVAPSAPSLKVARHEGRWVVFCEGRPVATAPTREGARQRARVLKTDPDFMADPQPDRRE